MAENNENKKLEATLKLSTKPTLETMPHSDWIQVADVLVDYQYQHRPYPQMIESLRKNFLVLYSGYILVSKREDGSYWAIDGQTRTEVHKLLQLRWIRAEILHGLSPVEEARVYLFKCINAKRMPVDFFLAEYMAREPVAVLIHDILDKRDIDIESYAVRQRRRGSDTRPVITCVSFLKRMIKRDPTGDILAMTLDLIRDTWDYTGNTLTGNFIEAIYKLLLVHADELDRKAFISKLSGTIPEELREQALRMRMGTNPRITVMTAMQRVVIDLYNIGRAQARRITYGSPQRNETL